MTDAPPRRRRRAGAVAGAAAAAVLLLGACGIKDDAQAAGDFCDQARTLSELDPELPETAEAVDQVADQFDRLAASAPSEIDDDMDLLADVYRQVAEAMAESGGDDPADLFAAAAPFFERAEEIEAASADVEQYLAEECGIEVDEDEGEDTTTTAVEDTTTSTEEETTTSTTEEETTTTEGGEEETLPPGEPPGDLGDDPALDQLANECFEGNMESCDALFFQSPVDSAYEAYAETCGGRNEPLGFCVGMYDGE